MPRFLQVPPPVGAIYFTAAPITLSLPITLNYTDQDVSSCIKTDRQSANVFLLTCSKKLV